MRLLSGKDVQETMVIFVLQAITTAVIIFGMGRKRIRYGE